MSTEKPGQEPVNGAEKWKLSPYQRKKLNAWIGEGLTPRAINARAAKLRDPFTITRQGIDHYRSKRKIQIKELRDAGEAEAFVSGFAIKNERLKALDGLAQTMLRELTTGKKLWVTDKKALGGGEHAEIYTFKRFNKAEVDAFRECLADIAAEVGARNAKALSLEVPSEGGPIKVYVGLDPDKV